MNLDGSWAKNRKKIIDQIEKKFIEYSFKEDKGNYYLYSIAKK